MLVSTAVWIVGVGALVVAGTTVVAAIVVGAVVAGTSVAGTIVVAATVAGGATVLTIVVNGTVVVVAIEVVASDWVVVEATVELAWLTGLLVEALSQAASKIPNSPNSKIIKTGFFIWCGIISLSRGGLRPALIQSNATDDLHTDS